MAEMSRDAEIKGIWAHYGWFYRLLRGAVLIGVGVLVGMLIYAEPQVRADYLMNLFVTVLGLGATALIFDELNRKRSEDELKRQLVMDAASISNEIAKNAIHQIRRKGWLDGEKGLLRGVDLSFADLHDVILSTTNLRNTKFINANLREAKLQWACLQGADLRWAKMQGARLEFANLQGADLRLAEFDESTTLPDTSLWTSETVMQRFTDLNHIDFWEAPG